MVEDTLFARVGHALRGSEGWIRPLARDLGIDRRTVERWATGRRQPPRDIWLWLLAALDREHNVETEKRFACRTGTVGQEQAGGIWVAKSRILR